MTRGQQITTMVMGMILNGQATDHDVALDKLVAAGKVTEDEATFYRAALTGTGGRGGST